jgi:molecular chaperone GrpE
VPFEVARTLQDQLDAHRERMDALQDELAHAETRLAAAQEQAAHTRTEAERLASLEPTPSDESARIQRLSEDLERVRARTAAEVSTARQAERADGLLRMAQVHDDLRRGLAALPRDPHSPWYRGYRAILEQLEQQLSQGGAALFGEVGSPFDPARHEAVGMAPGRADLIISVVQPGLVAHDGALLRPAQVIVGSGA